MRQIWIDELNKIEKDNNLVIIAYSKEDIEQCMDISITDDQWSEIIRQFNKCISSTEEICNLLCAISRDVVGD